MAVNLKWRDAMADWRIGNSFTPQEREQGWPQRMDLEQLAAMQRPGKGPDAASLKAKNDLLDALYDACEAGTLPSVPEVQRVAVTEYDDRELFRPIPLVGDGYGYEGQSMYAPPPKVTYEEHTFYLVAAADFAAWLVEQDMPPSGHIAAWLKACGITAGNALAGAATAQAAKDVKDMAALLQYRQQFAQQPEQEREPWHADHVALLAGWLRQEIAEGRARGAITRLEKLTGVRRQTLAELLARHGYTPTGEAEQKAVRNVQDISSVWGSKRHG
ncbi:hypothetical protein [Comamonas sp. AG1104]|uniref:hypothetical protein n=1 Tax=Comamonas sp. AG1104 TaxID=2183900 RepID=UPI000E2B3C9F|nr:hypothetical protein [Comamonas sp. AG1104]RDI10110.1 hypothetical protein DFO48_106270 [Comamonas sp. AG1104]